MSRSPRRSRGESRKRAVERTRGLWVSFVTVDSKSGNYGCCLTVDRERTPSEHSCQGPCLSALCFFHSVFNMAVGLPTARPRFPWQAWLAPFALVSFFAREASITVSSQHQFTPLSEEENSSNIGWSQVPCFPGLAV